VHPDQEELPVGRLEAFSDGVFAIAITLLVLELGISSKAGNHLLSSLLHHWPSYLAYLTSFMTIGIVWVQHSAITNTLRAADAALYRLNLLVLLLVAFLPFPTKLVVEFFADGGPERVAAVFYGLTMLAISFALAMFGRYVARAGRLVKDHIEADAINSAMRHSPSFVLYAIGIAVSLVVPTAGIVIYLASAISRGLLLQRLSLRVSH
jgi:uncharacterized membrane protein